MSIWSRLKTGLKKTSDKFTEDFIGWVNSKKIDANTLDELEEIFIKADMGVKVAAKLRTIMEEKKTQDYSDAVAIKKILAQEITNILSPLAKTLPYPANDEMHVVLVVGINGAGKTTTISKLANYWQKLGCKVGVVAADTFRAAAVEQLAVWAERLKINFYHAKAGTDPSSLIFESIATAKKENVKVLLIDTAGRLHNKSHLMEELKKIWRVIKKHNSIFPQQVLLVLDATNGQNIYNQVTAFQEAVQVNGLILTKLDGTAKGGIVIGLADKYQIPIYAIGIGEELDDLQPFNAQDFANNLLGLE